MSPICAESPLRDVFQDASDARCVKAFERMQVITLEDFHAFVSCHGSSWAALVPDMDNATARRFFERLQALEPIVGEVPDSFAPPVATSLATVAAQPISLPTELDGSLGTNRGTDFNSLAVEDDWAAIKVWLQARASNPNTYVQYRKEAERFLFWATMERGIALSSVNTQDAAAYPAWLEGLGRTDEATWAREWKLPQSRWIGAHRAKRLDADWHPFEGALSPSSRKTALTIIRQLFNFLTKTGYLRSNPFEQVSGKIHLLPGEGAPQAFADRSLSTSQWEAVLAYLGTLPESLETARLRVILFMGKGLGMRASEMIHARVRWIAIRRIGDEDLLTIEIVGKGEKIRRLPVSPEMLQALDTYFRHRGLPRTLLAPPDTPLLTRLRQRKGHENEELSRSGLFLTLERLFEGAAELVEQKSLADAAKLRASSTHWLRHTFAMRALQTMPLNIVQNAMGHASINTTSRYLTPEEAEVARAMRAMRKL